MRVPLSGVPVPTVPAPKPGPVPLPVQPREPQRRRKFFGWLVLVAALGIGGALWLKLRTQPDTGGGGPMAGPRTLTVGDGVINRTIRLTGSTGAEDFVSLIAPPMRGSRSFGGFSDRGNRSFRSSGSTSSGSSGGSSSTGGSSSASSGSTAGGSVASGDSSSSGGGAGGSNLASTGGAAAAQSSRSVRNTTSRFSTVRSGTSAASTKSSSGQTSSSAGSMGAEGLGSTSGELQGGGGPGGGGGGGTRGMGGGSNDFMMVLQTLAPSGAKVSKGDTIAEFDRTMMLLRLDDYRATLATAEAGFKRAMADLEVTRKAHGQLIEVAKAAVEKAALDLKTTPVRGDIDAERLRLAHEEAVARYKQLQSEVKFVRISEQAQVRVAELELEQTRLEVKRAESNADRMVVRTPIDGLVVIQNMFRGTEFSQIQAGDQVYPGMMFAQVVDTRSMVVNASINQVDVEKLKIGAKATIRFDAYPDLELPGRVVSIGAITKSGGFRASFLKEVPVRLKLDKMDPRVIPDLSVSADVVLESAPSSIVVPRESVFRDSEDSKPYAFVREGDAWQRRELELGLSNHTNVAVQSGLKAGDVIAESRPGSGPDVKDRSGQKAEGEQ